MASFTFNGSQELVYPNITTGGKVLVAKPGQSYDLDAAPDARWSSEAPKKAPEAPEAPATPEVPPVTTTNN
jgi:hypothetical protein